MNDPLITTQTKRKTKQKKEKNQDLMTIFKSPGIDLSMRSKKVEIEAAIQSMEEVNIVSIIEVYNKWKGTTWDFETTTKQQLLTLLNTSVCRHCNAMNPMLECIQCYRFVHVKCAKYKGIQPYICNYCSNQ